MSMTVDYLIGLLEQAKKQAGTGAIFVNLDVISPDKKTAYSGHLDSSKCYLEEHMSFFNKANSFEYETDTSYRSLHLVADQLE